MTYHPNFPPSLCISPNPPSNADQDIADVVSVFGITAQREAIQKYGIAGRVWEAAFAMCSYLDSCHVLDSDTYQLEFDPPFFDGGEDGAGRPTVIELGSGTGIVAARIVGSASFPEDAIMIATDLPDVCPLLEHNLHGPSVPVTSCDGLSRPRHESIFVRPLAWGSQDDARVISQEFGLCSDTGSHGHSSSIRRHRLTHIVCSDLVYFPELLGPLLRTLIHLTSPPCVPATDGGHVKIVISYKIRSLQKETPFWTAFGLWFTFQPVLFRKAKCASLSSRGDDLEGDISNEEADTWSQFGSTEAHTPDRTFIFVANRRPESFSWEVPQRDRDLLAGVGAKDTPFSKGDDTFETILFMAMQTVE